MALYMIFLAPKAAIPMLAKSWSVSVVNMAKSTSLDRKSSESRKKAKFKYNENTDGRREKQLTHLCNVRVQ